MTDPIASRAAPRLPPGAILAGGRSRRMGEDKADLVIGSRTLLACVLERVVAQVAALVLVGGPRERAQTLGMEYRSDGVTGSRGPLAGLMSAMDFAGQTDPGARFVFVTATDTPFLPTDLVASLMANESASGDVPIFPRYGGRVQPLAGLWPVSLRDVIASGLETGTLESLKDIYQATGYGTLEIGEQTPDPFFNVNTPSDLCHAKQYLS